MARSPFASNPVIVRLPVLVEEIASRGIRIPRFQRPFEWSDGQRLTLLDSIKQGLPIGSLLTWKTSTHKLASYEKLGPFALRPALDEAQRTYLLDGHQRVSTLYGALWSTPVATDSEEETSSDDETRWPIYYDLEAEKFLLAGRKQRSRPNTWLPLSTLFDGEALWQALAPLRESGRSDLAKRARALAETFTDYQVPVVPILSEDLPQVIESFRRINSQGTAMSEVSMVRALTWSTDFDRVAQLEQLIGVQLVPLGWGELEPQELLDALKVFFKLRVYDSEATELSAIVKDTNKMTRFASCLKQAIQFLLAHCGIAGPKLLPYRYQLACLIAAAGETEKLGGDTAACNRLEQWFWATTYQEYFGGAMDRQLREAAEHVRALAKGPVGVGPAHGLGKQTALPRSRRFQLKSARSRALALLLLRQQPQQEDGTVPTTVAERVSREGGVTIPKIVTSSQLSLDEGALSDSPGNRWIALPEHVFAMMNKLRQGPVGSTFLRSHLISEAAARSYENQRYADFIRQRETDLFREEEQFAAAIGAAQRVRGRTSKSGR